MGQLKSGGKKGGLGVFWVPLGVHAEFGEEDGAVPGEMVEARQVALEGFSVFEVDIERGEIGRGWLEVFGGGEIGVGDGLSLIHI